MSEWTPRLRKILHDRLLVFGNKSDIKIRVGELSALLRESDHLTAENTALVLKNEGLVADRDRPQSLLDNAAGDARELAEKCCLGVGLTLGVESDIGYDVACPASVNIIREIISACLSRREAALRSELDALKSRLAVTQTDRECAERITACACGEFTTDEFESIIAAHCLPLRQRIEEARKIFEDIAHYGGGAVDACSDHYVMGRVNAWLATPVERGEGE